MRHLRWIWGVPFLGRIPLETGCRHAMRCWRAVCHVLFRNTPTADAYHTIANKVDAFARRAAVTPRATAPSTLNGHENIQLFRDGHGPILLTVHL